MKMTRDDLSVVLIFFGPLLVLLAQFAYVLELHKTFGFWAAMLPIGVGLYLGFSTEKPEHARSRSSANCSDDREDDPASHPGRCQSQTSEESSLKKGEIP